MWLLPVWVRSGPSPAEERVTYGWGGGLSWRTRQCGQRSLVLDMTNGWGNMGVGPGRKGDPQGLLQQTQPRQAPSLLP